MLYTLNLDKDYKPVRSTYVQKELTYNVFNFLGGEPSVKLYHPYPINKTETLIITQRVTNSQTLLEIILANDAARRLGFQDIELVCPYFPGARQDRVCNQGEALTLSVFADMINQCGFSKVHILTPHSEVTPALINNVTLMPEFHYQQTVSHVIKNPTPVINVVCPDAGAGKRTEKIVKQLAAQEFFTGIHFELIRCEKIRDVTTGELKNFFVLADDLGWYPTIIFDDIVSMGGTFIGLGNKLKEKNCGTLFLSVTHADCNEGVEKMCDFFDHVFITNSRPITVNRENLSVLEPIAFIV